MGIAIHFKIEAKGSANEYKSAHRVMVHILVYECVVCVQRFRQHSDCAVNSIKAHLKIVSFFVLFPLTVLIDWDSNN